MQNTQKALTAEDAKLRRVQTRYKVQSYTPAIECISCLRILPVLGFLCETLRAPGHLLWLRHSPCALGHLLWLRHSPCTLR